LSDDYKHGANSAACIKLRKKLNITLLLSSIRLLAVLNHSANSWSFFAAVKVTEESPIEVYISRVTSIPVTNCLSFLSSEKITKQSLLDLFFFHVIFIIISTPFRGDELRK
jgi:hypothetical protein